METIFTAIVATGSFWIPLILGLVFLLIPAKDIDLLKYYYRSKYLMSLAYISFGIFSLLVLITNPDFLFNNTIRSYAPLIAIVQIIIFSYVNITLIKPSYLSLRKLLRPLVPSLLLSGLYIFSFIHKPFGLFHEIMYYILFAFFAFLIFYYSFEFSKYYRMYQLQLDNFYSELSSNHLHWVLKSQVIVVVTGIMVFFAGFIPTSFMGAFLAVMILFFSYYAFRYIQYGITFSEVEAILDEKETKESSRHAETSQNQLSKAISEWENHKKFTAKSLTVENVAASLSTNRTYLSNYINTQKKKTFNEWINGLRIDEAKNLMINEPGIPILEVCELVGFTDKSNFGRHFSKITGYSPAVWRREQLNNKKI